MLGRVVVGLWLAILAVVPAAAQDYERGMAAYRQGDYATALSNWRPLARRGHAAAQSSLGFMFNYGHGVPRDYGEALKWYRRAAGQGYPAAQYHLGFLYTKGLGVAQDYVRAHMWFSLGAEGGLAYSEKNRDILARRMTAEQIAESEELVREWRSKAKDRAKTKAAGKRKSTSKAAAKRRVRRKAAPQPSKSEKSVPSKTSEAPGKTEADPGVQVAARGAVSVPSKDADAAPSPSAEPGKGRFMLQLGASKSKALADKAAARIAKAHRSVLGGVKVRAVRTDLGSRGVYYRLRAGPIADDAVGKEMCRKLVARGQSCLLLQN